ncbi:unnamed protein product [Polarella glacialis]|uniref:Uncharacterized protein n=1 Tax=Polarella glacialis TaxID=89957 RepID=A0A813KCE0_POLGL|nr:unnamed protein product [Polarella glacialis]
MASAVNGQAGYESTMISSTQEPLTKDNGVGITPCPKTSGALSSQAHDNTLDSLATAAPSDSSSLLRLGHAGTMSSWAGSLGPLGPLETSPETTLESLVPQAEEDCTLDPVFLRSQTFPPNMPRLLGRSELLSTKSVGEFLDESPLAAASGAPPQHRRAATLPTLLQGASGSSPINDPSWSEETSRALANVSLTVFQQRMQLISRRREAFRI